MKYFCCVVLLGSVIGIATAQQVTFDFRSTVTPVGDTSDFFDIGDNIQLVCDANPGPASYTIHIRVNDSDTGETTRLTNSALAERQPATVSVNVAVKLNATSYQCFASHNDQNGIDEAATFTTLINPFFTALPDDPLLLVNGTEITSLCVANGLPVPTVQLLREDVVIDESLSPVDVVTFKFGDSGMHQCIASTPGADRNVTFNFTVIISPVGSVRINESDFMNGDTEIVLLCSTEGGPGNNFTWFKGNVTISSNNDDFMITTTTDTRQEVRITNLISGSLVMYTCLVENQAGQENATIDIQVPIQNFLDVMPANQSVDLGTEARFVCSNPGLQPNEFFWIRNLTSPTSIPNIDLIDLTVANNPYIITNGPVLVISESTLDDGGVYACVSNVSEVSVVEPAVLSITPNITNTLMEMFVEEGDRVVFPCMATGFPTPTYHWEKMNSSTGIFEEIPNETNDELVFDPVQFDNFGRYKCVATVDFLQTNIDQSNHVLLHVSPAGSVITSPMVVTEEHGQNVSLHCDSQGGPNNMYFWVRNASEEVCLDCAGVVDFKTFLEGIALSNDTIDILSFEQYLTIQNLNATQHGGTYFCVAINEAGYGISMSTINVLPAIVVQPQDFKSIAHASAVATFTCEAESFPSPSYRWEKLPSMAVDGASDSSLDITPVEFDSFGDYRCIAFVNISGQVNETASDAATLFVSPLGSVESNPPGPILLDQGESFSLNCSGSGGPSNTYMYLLDDEVIDTMQLFPAGITLASSSLQVEAEADAALHKGLYTCVVSNMAGNDTDTTLVIISPFGIVSVSPLNITSSREMNVSFLCDTDSGPGNNYFWFKNMTNVSSLSNQERSDLSISNEQTLVLQNITAADGGVYSCLAVNQAGVGEASGTLNLIPEFVVQPQGANTTVDSTLTLTCVAEAFPSPSTQWQKMNRMTGIFENIPSENSTTLSFSPVQYSDFGMYRCVATNTINGVEFITFSDNALVVVSPEGSIQLTPQNNTVDFQSTANLTCVVEGGPMNDFRWFLNDTELVSGNTNVTITSSLLYSVLEISSVSAPVHGGTYRCEVANPAGLDQNDTQLFVSPRFLEEPVPVTLAPNGSSVTLVCRAEAFPVPQYRWLDSRHGSTIVGDPQPLLIFSPVLFGAESVYTCVVSSNDLSITSQASTLHVSPFGSVAVTPQVQNGLHGLNYTTICSASGGLDNQFSWTYLRTGDELVTTPSLDLLNIDILQAGDYQCTVSNQAGNESVIYTLNIGPRIVEQPQAINVTIDIEDIVLSCTATGLPSPGIIWFHNDTPIIDDGESVTVDSIAFNNVPAFDPSDFGKFTSILTINNASTNDTGLYKCVANNGIGSTIESEEVLVLVQDVPQAPHTILADEVFSQNLSLVWFEPHDNNAPIQGYYVIYTNPSFINNGAQEIIIVDEAIEELDVLELHPGVTYMFTIIAFNEIGNSSASEAFVVTTMEEEPSGPPLEVRGTSGSPTSIILSWMLPEEIERRGVIISYDIHYMAMNEAGNIIDQGIANTGTMQFVLTGLMEFTNYSIQISARTEIGPGPLSSPIFVLTNETFPGPIDEPTVSNADSTSIQISWNPPEDSNGMIVAYNVEYFPQRLNEQVFRTTQGTRRRRQIFVDQPVVDCINSLNISNNGSNIITVEGTRTFQLLTGLIPFTEYIARVRAVTVVGPGNYSNFTTFNTRAAAPGPVLILEAIAIDGSSARIKWSAPFCPNGPVSGYKVYHRRSAVAQTSFPITNHDGYIETQVNSTELVVTLVINDLDQGATYAIHVQAIYSNEAGVEVPGEVVQEVTVTIENEVIPPTRTTLTDTDTGSNTATIGLPPVADFSTSGITDIRYYGVVIVPDPISDFKLSEANFDDAYPNVQPFNMRGDNRHYIAVAWNNMSAIPEDFVIGDETTTTAIRNGIEEMYFNAKLDTNTMHCIYVLIHYSTDGSNDLVVRYAELDCVKTDRGYHLAGLIVGIILAFLLLCCLLLLLIILLVCCCKRRRKRYSDYYSPPEARPMKEIKPFTEPETVISNVYASNSDLHVSSKTSVPVLQYPEYVKNMHSNSNFLFTEEYTHIEPKHTPSKTSSLANKSKDRYLNIPAYDHSRVVLKHCPTGTNYINANYIAGYGKDGSFIATQGPMASTTTDFWYMVWEQDVSTIVMLTNLEEKGKVKCHKYWPNSPHNGENLEAYGSLQVQFLEEKKEDHQVVRVFHLSMEGSIGRQIKQYHFTAWPDHGVPSSAEALLDFVDQVKNKYNVADGPTVVHCSAGVGRTGAFIALYVQMARAEKEGTIDIHKFVQYMRKQRPSMVLNETEYIFVHDALMQALRMGLIKGVEIDFSRYDEKQKTPALDDNGSVEVEAENDFSFEEGILGDSQENGSSM